MICVGLIIRQLACFVHTMCLAVTNNVLDGKLIYNNWLLCGSGLNCSKSICWIWCWKNVTIVQFLFVSWFNWFSNLLRRNNCVGCSNGNVSQLDKLLVNISLNLSMLEWMRKMVCVGWLVWLIIVPRLDGRLVGKEVGFAVTCQSNSWLS